MACLKCKSKRVASVSAKCSDLCDVRLGGLQKRIREALEGHNVFVDHEMSQFVDELVDKATDALIRDGK